MSALAASGFIFIFVTGGEEEGGRVSLGEAATTLATDVLTSSDGYSPTFEVGEVLSIEPFLIRIDRVRTAKSIGSEYWSTRANGEAVYLVVEYSFKNDGAQQLSAYNAPDIIIRDADQNWLAPSPSPAEVMKANILASEFSQQTFYNGDPINPGITYQDVVVFEIDEDRLGEAGWRLVPNYNDREVLVRFMNEPSSNFERPEYLNPVSSETHSAVEVAELGAMLHVDTIFLGGNCCEATLIGGIALTQAFSCPRNVEGELYEYEVEICGQNCGTDTFAICVPSTFDSIADLILVNDEYGHIEARSLSIKLEKLYVYRAG
jgi:hypothetical protein